MEIAGEALDSTSAVAHRILLLTTQLGESLLASLGAEDGVIAEAMVTGALERDLAIDCALEEVRPVFVDKGDDGTEASTTWGRYPLETLQKESYILFEGSMLPCEACGVDSRSSVKSLDLELTPDVSETDHLQTSREEGTDLLQLMGIIARKYQLFHTFVS